MKKNLFLVIASILCSGSAFANVSTLQCYLSLLTEPDRMLAITSTDLTPEGGAIATEADTMLIVPEPETARFSFSVEVENNVITSMRLEDKKEGIVSEQTDLIRDSYMSINLQSSDMAPTLECFLNII